MDRKHWEALMRKRHGRIPEDDSTTPEPLEGEYMSNAHNGNVGPADVATLSLLGRGPYGFGGYGYGYTGDSVLAAQTHADGTAVAAKVEANGKATEAQSLMFDTAERSRQFSTVGDQIDAVRFALADNAKEAAKCCCDAQLVAEQNKSELMAEIKAVESRGITRELDRAERQLENRESTAAIIAAMQAQTQQLVAVLNNGN